MVISLLTFVISFGCNLGHQVLILVFAPTTVLFRVGFNSYTWDSVRQCSLVRAWLLEVSSLWKQRARRTAWNSNFSVQISAENVFLKKDTHKKSMEIRHHISISSDIKGFMSEHWRNCSKQITNKSGGNKIF